MDVNDAILITEDNFTRKFKYVIREIYQAIKIQARQGLDFCIYDVSYITIDDTADTGLIKLIVNTLKLNGYKTHIINGILNIKW